MSPGSWAFAGTPSALTVTGAALGASYTRHSSRSWRPSYTCSPEVPRGVEDVAVSSTLPRSLPSSGTMRGVHSRSRCRDLRPTEAIGRFSFHPRGFTPPRRLPPLSHSRACCIPHQTWGSSRCSLFAPPLAWVGAPPRSRDASPFEELPSRTSVPCHQGRCPLAVGCARAGRVKARDVTVAVDTACAADISARCRASRSPCRSRGVPPLRGEARPRLRGVAPFVSPYRTIPLPEPHDLSIPWASPRPSRRNHP